MNKGLLEGESVLLEGQGVIIKRGVGVTVP